ncbi:MAG TPA: RibD family protein [Vicinamibacterales bacterium]|nr:RibD family protein [Vicinamibacterales bacterium]
MQGSPSASRPDTDTAIDAAWAIVLASSRAAEAAASSGATRAFAIASRGELLPVEAADPKAVVIWRVGVGWESTLAPTDPRRALLDLYLPITSATSARPVTIGHLGQSLDGFIATHSGESQYVTGEENILHLHRMRALCDAVIVGAGTVAADDPQLTTRRVPGPNPLRVVLDPSRRLAEHYKVFTDDSAETLYICTERVLQPGETFMGRAAVRTVNDAPNGMDAAAVLALLRERGCHRIFVEGGGVTVSMFLQADLLDRLQVAIAPLIIGNGRPAIRLPARDALSECRRPRYRVFRMGDDVFFDCDLRDLGHGPEEGAESVPLVTRII